LREHVFIHLTHPQDKLGMLLAMTAKLFALVGGTCGEDNADALSHHEVLLPGTLLSKFMSDKLAEALGVFKRQVSLCSLLAAVSLASRACRQCVKEEPPWRYVIEARCSPSSRATSLQIV
jgi:DNA-directed RNA polymerase beta subunit